MTPRVITAAIAAAVLVPAALAEASVRTTVVARGASTDAFAVSADIGQRGAAIVGWTSEADSNRVRVALRSRVGARFGSGRTLGAGRLARVAISPNGRSAGAVWTSNGEVVAAVSDRRGRWDRSRIPLVEPGSPAIVSAFTMVADRRAILVVQQRTAERWRLSVWRFNGQRWIASGSLTAPGQSGGQAAVSANGTVFVAWIQPVGGERTGLFASAREVGARRWARTRMLARAGDGETLSLPVVDAAPNGQVAVLVARERGGRPVSAEIVTGVPRSHWIRRAISPRASMGMAQGGRIWSVNVQGEAFQARSLAGVRNWSPTERISPVSSSQVKAGPGVQRAWGAVAAWWVLDQGENRPSRWMVSSRGQGGWTRPLAVANTDGVVAFAGGPGGLMAVYSTADNGGRVVVADITSPPTARRTV